MGLIRTLITLAAILAFIWFGATVPLGQRTLFGHIGNIWAAEETQELVEGVQESSGPMVDKVRRGVKAGIEAASGGDAAPADRSADDAPGADGASERAPGDGPAKSVL